MDKPAARALFSRATLEVDCGGWCGDVVEEEVVMRGLCRGGEEIVMEVIERVMEVIKRVMEVREVSTVNV